MSVNHVSLTGEVATSRAQGTSADGTPWMRCRLRVTNEYETWEGFKTRSSYVSLVAFGRDVEQAKEAFVKGAQVAVDGEIISSSWIDGKTNTRRDEVSVKVHEAHRIWLPAADGLAQTGAGQEPAEDWG